MIAKCATVSMGCLPAQTCDDSSYSKWQRSLYWTALCTLLMLGAGCGKEAGHETQPASIPQESSQSDSAAQPVRPAESLSPPTTANPGETLSQLTRAVRQFSVERRRVPANLEELVAAGYLSHVPSAPAGQKYAVDPKTVSVVLERR